MKFTCSALILAFLLLTCQAAIAANDAPADNKQAAAEIDKEKAAAADRYLETLDAKELFEGTFQALRERLPQQDSKIIVDRLAAEIRYDEVKTILRDAIAKHFTTEELDALAEFYGSDLGKSITKKYPAYITDVNTAVQMEAQRAFKTVLEAYVAEKEAQEKAAADAKAKEEKKKTPADAKNEKAEEPAKKE